MHIRPTSFRRLVVGDTSAPEEENRSRREGDKTRQKRIMCSKNPTMLVLCAILLVLPKTEAIKFSAEGVSVP